MHNTSFVAYLSRGRVVTFGFGLRAALADAYETEFEAIAAVEEVGARNAHDVTELSER